MHYSFNFAQQVLYTYDPMQPGPTYFLTNRKCGIFGVHCEAVPQQQNYLIDEGMKVSKGSIAVLSYVHDFFENDGLGERHCQLHCDNCPGQNKNKYAMWYLAWRTINGLHESISVNFLIAGHTKFGPDWGFGLLKQRYRKSMVSCLDDLVEVVNSSSTSGVNKARVVGSESGEVYVRTYDWQRFLAPYFKPFPGILACHHMRFSHDHPGVVFFKQHIDSEEQSLQLLKNPNVLPPLELPDPLTPPGLSYARQQYLYANIREFCSHSTRDVVCPEPVEPADR